MKWNKVFLFIIMSCTKGLNIKSGSKEDVNVIN